MNLITRIARAPLALGLVVVAAVAMFAAPLLPAAPPPEPVPQEQQADWLLAQQALAAAERTALEDPELKALIEGLDAAVQAGMREADPEHDARVARLTAIQTELAAGTPSETLAAEALALEEQLQATQAEVLAAEPVASRIEAAQARILAKMTEIDPQVPARIARLEAAAQ